MWKTSTKPLQNTNLSTILGMYGNTDVQFSSFKNFWQHWQGNDPFAIHYMEVIEYISKWYLIGLIFI